MVFGLEDDDDGFVELVDCRHIFKASKLDLFVEYEEKKGIVQLISCPQCKTPIRRTMRYHTVINKFLACVELAKKKMKGEEMQLLEMAKDIEKNVSKKFNREKDKYATNEKDTFLDNVRNALAKKNVSNVQHLHSKEHCVWQLMALLKDAEMARTFGKKRMK